jgi:hypothetical protein
MTQLVVIISFKGGSDDLLERFEQARRLWIEDQDPDYEQPAFYAACSTDEGIAIVSGWESAPAHRAFGEGLHSHIDGVGLPPPDGIERLRIGKLGWD